MEVKHGVLLWNKLKFGNLGNGNGKGHVTLTVPFRMCRNNDRETIRCHINQAVIRKFIELGWPHAYDNVAVTLPHWNDGIHEAQITIWDLCESGFDFYHKMYRDWML